MSYMPTLTAHWIPGDRPRADPRGGDGSLPVSGSDDAHEWKGWIPFDDMPHIYDPPVEFSQPRMPHHADGYKYSISTEWETPWRTDRIYRVLESGKKFAVADMLALQMDVSSTSIISARTDWSTRSIMRQKFPSKPSGLPTSCAIGMAHVDCFRRADD